VTRKPEQAVVVGGVVVITVLEIKGRQVRLGIDAPRDVVIQRSEVVPDTDPAPNAAED
jgi:carbon storage regulator